MRRTAPSSVEGRCYGQPPRGSLLGRMSFAAHCGRYSQGRGHRTDGQHAGCRVAVGVVRQPRIRRGPPGGGVDEVLRRYRRGGDDGNGYEIGAGCDAQGGGGPSTHHAPRTAATKAALLTRANAIEVAMNWAPVGDREWRTGRRQGGRSPVRARLGRRRRPPLALLGLPGRSLPPGRSEPSTQSCRRHRRGRSGGAARIHPARYPAPPSRSSGRTSRSWRRCRPSAKRCIISRS